VLQYGWTGQLARAEVRQRHADLEDQAVAMARAFDTALQRHCMMLLPDRTAIEAGDLPGAFLARFRAWKAVPRPPLFARLALVLPEFDRPRLFELDQMAEKLRPIDWPVAWNALEDNLARKRTVGSPPYFDPTGTLVEFPIFREFPSRGGELGWVIVQLDLDYVRSVWLPELVQTYLELGKWTVNDARVLTSAEPPGALYSLTGGAPSVPSSLVSVRFNHLGRMPDDWREPPSSPHWTLQTWCRPGASEAIAAAARWRNFAVALVLNLLMLVTGMMLLAQMRRAQQLAEARMQFVASVSHEFRTPLTVIRGAAHNLRRGILHSPAQIKQYSQLIMEHADDLAEMVEQTLALAAAAKCGALVLPQPLAPARLLEEALAATAPEVWSAHCTVEVDLPPTLPAIVGDPLALRQVFQNLLSNAVRHGGPGGWIGITGTSDASRLPLMVEIQVADHGPGIPAEEQAEVFEPFFRGASAQVARVRGSGLGLALVREIVEAHGGTVSVCSAVGAGTTFKVRLPASTVKREQ